MNYTLLDEDEKTFRLKDKNGKEFTVAKQAIGDALLTKIRGFAEGGVVEKTTQEPRAVATKPFETNNWFEALEYGAAQAALPFVEPFFREEGKPYGEPYKEALQQRIETTRSQAPTAAKTPSKLIAGQVTADSMPIVPITQQGLVRAGIMQGEQVGQVPGGQAAGPAIPDLASAMQQTAAQAGTDEMMRAIQLQKTAGEQLAKDQLKAQQEAEKARMNAEEVFNRNVSAIQKQNDDLFNAAMNNKIEPRRLFSNASMGAKVSAAIGLVLGGIGQGLAGGQNQALATLNKLIDDDIEAQKANLGKTQTLYGQNLQRLGDERAAFAATKSQIASFVEGRVAQAAAKAAIPQVQATALQATAQIKQYQAKLNQEIAQRKTAQMLLDYVRKSGSVQYAEMLPEEQRKEIMPRLVPGYGVAPTKERAAKLMDSAATNEIVTNAISQLQGFGKKSYSDFSPEDRARAEQIQNILIGDLRIALTGPGALTDSEREWMESIIANPTNIFELNARARLEEIKKSVQSRFNQELKASGLRPKPQLDIQAVK